MGGWRAALGPAAGALLGASGGCTPVVPVEPRAAAAEALRDEELAARFAPARALMEGLSPVEPGAAWRPGDRVLLGIAEDGGGPGREWYMRIEALQPPEVEVQGRRLAPRDSFTFRTGAPGGERTEVTARFGLVPMKVRVYDSALNTVSEVEAMMPEISLRHGLIEHIRQERDGVSLLDAAHNGPEEDGLILASEVQLRGLAGLLALVRFPQFVGRLPAAEGLAWRLMDRPSLISVVAHGGVSMAVRLAPLEAVPVAPPPGVREPVFRVPVWVELNGRRALDCTLLLAAADPPLGPCNGVLALEASHPRHPERRVRVRLLAAERGAPAG